MLAINRVGSDEVTIPPAPKKDRGGKTREGRLKTLHYKLAQKRTLIAQLNCTDAAHDILKPYFTRLRLHADAVVRGVARELSTMPYERKFLLIVAERLLERVDVFPQCASRRNILALLGATYILHGDPRMKKLFMIKGGIVRFNKTRVEMKTG